MVAIIRLVWSYEPVDVFPKLAQRELDAITAQMVTPSTVAPYIDIDEQCRVLFDACPWVTYNLP